MKDKRSESTKKKDYDHGQIGRSKQELRHAGEPTREDINAFSDFGTCLVMRLGWPGRVVVDGAGRWPNGGGGTVGETRWHKNAVGEVMICGRESFHSQVAASKWLLHKSGEVERFFPLQKPPEL